MDSDGVTKATQSLHTLMWYYEEDGQQRGPVMEADFAALRREGKISGNTLVWREGMANWQPLGDVQPAAAAAQNSSAPPADPSAPATTGPLVVCSQCGRSFPPDEVIRYGSATVCADCKPVFVQKLKEGAEVGGGAMVYASFWIRFAAYVLDGIITGVIGAVLGAVLGLAWVALAGGGAGKVGVGSIIALQVVSTLLSLGVRAAYFIYFIGRSGQTPGKKLCNIRVVNADGTAVGYGKATGRFFGYFLSSFILMIGFLMAAWDDERRALHDRLCNTRVIKA